MYVCIFWLWKSKCQLCHCLKQLVFMIINKKYIHVCMYILAVEK